MRIEALSTLVAVVWLTAVLCPRLSAANNLTLSSSSSRRPREEPFREHISRAELLEEPTNKRMTYREMQMILRQEGGEDGLPVDCCPSIVEMVQPFGGRTREDMYVELYRDGDNVQRFFEYSCRPDVVGKPCRFVDRKFSEQSRCVQKYAYTYAIIQTPPESEIRMEEHKRHHHKEHYHLPGIPENTVTGSGWALDYIRVRGGCGCEIMPKLKKKKIAATKARKAKSKQRQPRDQESNFET